MFKYHTDWNREMMKGMGGNHHFRIFLIYIFNYAFFSLKPRISYPYNSYKIIQFFIWLSGIWAFISNTIYGSERSLKQPSTTLRLIFVRSLCSSTTSSPPPPRPRHRKLRPSIQTRAPPLHWGMWARSGELQNTSHDICRGSFSLSLFLSPH